MELIEKSAVVAEIEKRKQEWQYGSSIEAKYKHEECDDILSSINTIEVKDVNLEKEIELVKGDYEQVDVAWNNDFDFIARHFFELGFQKAQKGDKL